MLSFIEYLAEAERQSDFQKKVTKTLNKPASTLQSVAKKAANATSSIANPIKHAASTLSHMDPSNYFSSLKTGI